MRKLLTHIKFRFSFPNQISDIISNYTPLTQCQRTKLILKESYLSATDTHNGDHYSALSDLLSFYAAKRMNQKMRDHSVGRKILQEKPRITDQIFRRLGKLPDGSFGKAYFGFMDGLNFRPSERPVVKYIPDLQYAYTLQRYKEIHDFLHVLLGKQISVDEELEIKWFEMRQLQLPSASLASLISPILGSNLSIGKISKMVHLADKAHFIMNIYYQDHFEEPIDQVRTKFGFH